MSLNKAEFIGNLGGDARIATVGDKRVANFSIAVNEKRKGEEKTTWVRCALWGVLVDKIGEYLSKGKQVFVSGPISIEEWTTKDGEVRRDLNLMVNDIVLLGGGSDKRPAESKPAADPTQHNPFAK